MYIAQELLVLKVALLVRVAIKDRCKSSEIREFIATPSAVVL